MSVTAFAAMLALGVAADDTMTAPVVAPPTVSVIGGTATAIEPAQDQAPASSQPETVIAPPIAPTDPASVEDGRIPATAAGTAPSRGGDQHDVTVTARVGPTPGDPFEAINEQSYALTQKVDVAVVSPVSRAYRSVAPVPVRDGLRNVFRNLHEPSNFLNFVLQHKIGKAAETVARFTINSTVGVLGLFDIARRKPFKLQPRFNSLSNTLGFYGIGPGPFFFLPLIGPTTLRDALGNAVDGLTLPLAVGKPFTSQAYTVPSSAFRSIDQRVRIDDKLTEIKAAPNPYAASRAYYLERRQAEIDHLRGKNVPGADGNTFPGGTPPAARPVPAASNAGTTTPAPANPR